MNIFFINHKNSLQKFTYIVHHVNLDQFGSRIFEYKNKLLCTVVLVIWSFIRQFTLAFCTVLQCIFWIVDAKQVMVLWYAVIDSNNICLFSYWNCFLLPLSIVKLSPENPWFSRLEMFSNLVTVTTYILYEHRRKKNLFCHQSCVFLYEKSVNWYKRWWRDFFFKSYHDIWR